MAALLAYIRASTDEAAPLIPSAWDHTIEVDGWTTIYPLTREAEPGIYFHARLILRHPSNPGRALFVCTGPRAILDRLAARIALDALPWSRTWLTLGELRTDASQLATQVKASWPDERPRDESGQPIGTLVAHLRRMAGHSAYDAES